MSLFSAPGLSWDAMLEMAGVTLEKISDPDKYMFLNKEWEVELVILIKDTAKRLKVSIFSTMTWIICMNMQWVNIYHTEDLNNLKI